MLVADQPLDELVDLGAQPAAGERPDACRQKRLRAAPDQVGDMLGVGIGLDPKVDDGVGVGAMSAQSRRRVGWRACDRVLGDEVHDLGEVVAQDQPRGLAAVAELAVGELFALELEFAQSVDLLGGGAHVVPPVGLAA